MSYCGEGQNHSLAHSLTMMLTDIHVSPVYVRYVPDTTLPDTGFNRIVIYRIPEIPDSSKFKIHKS